MPVQTPKKATLQKYGLSEAEWQVMADAQGHRCFVCEKTPTTGRLVIDHEHVKGWKKMPPEQRKLYVRGLLCWVCNHYYVGRGITVAKAENVVRYLSLYAARRPATP
jgi:hypothetical protein